MKACVRSSSQDFDIVLAAFYLIRFPNDALGMFTFHFNFSEKMLKFVYRRGEDVLE